MVYLDVDLDGHFTVVVMTVFSGDKGCNPMAHGFVVTSRLVSNGCGRD